MNDFKTIIGQELAIQILESAIYKKRIAPAYLFWGPEGVGRKKTAEIFIKEIINKGIEQESTKRKIENNNHPDLIWVKPSYLVQGKIILQDQAKSENLSIKGLPKIRLNEIKKIIEFQSMLS